VQARKHSAHVLLPLVVVCVYELQLIANWLAGLASGALEYPAGLLCWFSGCLLHEAKAVTSLTHPISAAWSAEQELIPLHVQFPAGIPGCVQQHVWCSKGSSVPAV
jgi:hypothetical protein